MRRLPPGGTGLGTWPGIEHSHYSLTVSPDDEWILYGEQPVPTRELMLVENFR